MIDIDDVALDSALRHHFGHEAFRPGQREVVRDVLAGAPTLAVMPTGAGKSLCYQLPALLLDGPTVVVSPLVALMKDQVDALRRRGVATSFLNSAQSEREREAVEREIAEGRVRVLYVAPERFRSASFVRALAGRRLALVAVDEAHCVSEWGHSFRPDYERLGEVVESLAPERVLALTATAAPDVRADIVRSLRMRNASVHVHGFDRPNLHLEAHELQSEAERRDSILVAVRAVRPAIVYTATRRHTEELARALVRTGLRARPYHAGLEDTLRSETQDRFLEGDLDVVCATNAFGLGVDKPDVRLVLHAELPRSIEAYWQEVGRAGRDGKPALGGLLFLKKDMALQRRLLDLGSPKPETVAAAFRVLKDAPGPLTKDQVGARLGVSGKWSAGSVLAVLESMGLVDRRWAPGPLELRLAGRRAEPGESARSRLGVALGGLRGMLSESDAATALGVRSRAELHQTLDALERSGELTRRKVAPAPVYAMKDGALLDAGHMARLRARAVRERTRLTRMADLALGSGCRRRALLEALGEAGAARRCGACDACVGARLTPVRSRLRSAPPPAFRP